MKKFKNQKEMFEFIWSERDHVSEIDGSPLPNKNHPQWHWCFAHLLSKGAYPAYKLNPNNVMLMTPDQHENQEEYEAFQEKKKELKKAYYSDPNIKH